MKHRFCINPVMLRSCVKIFRHDPERGNQLISQVTDSDVSVFVNMFLESHLIFICFGCG
jgi:hypothetical protein